jgi:hypothetical protein
MVTQSIQTVAGAVIPDTALVCEVTDFIRNAEDELLFDRSRRVFLFGALAAFTDGMKHRPRTTFGTLNADVLQHYDPTFVRDDFVDIVLNSTWPDSRPQPPPSD